MPSDKSDLKQVTTRMSPPARAQLKYIAEMAGLTLEDWLIDAVNTKLIRDGHDMLVARVSAPLNEGELQALLTKAMARVERS